MRVLTGDRLQAPDLYRMMATANMLLQSQKEFINALNVFPVPDGDTGNNMCLTMKAATDQMSSSSSDLAEAANSISYGSLMGARGNSGVILSQILRGLAHGLEGQPDADARTIADALQQGVKTAYRAVMKPVEGTMLTVVREAAGAAHEAAGGGAGIDSTLEAACKAARVALDRTPEQLEVLKRAGVVDAGGQGLLCILEGMLAGWRGEDIPVLHQPTPTRVAFEITEDLSDITFPYDTELLIRGEDVDHSSLQQCLEQMGDSIVLVDGGSLTKVHIHTSTPGEVLIECLKHGDVDDVVIKNMIEQHRQLEHRPGGGEWTVSDLNAHQRPENAVGLVVVASGDGFGRLFREMGADAVVPGGQTMNPSTQEILDAVESVAGEVVIILPNNSNVVLTCRQVDELTEKEVHVVETRDMAQGVAALLPWHSQKDVSELVASMEQALGDVATGAVTYAVREAQIDDVEIAEGSVLGLTNGQIVVAGQDPESVLIELIAKTMNDDSEIVSVFVGDMVNGDLIDSLGKTLDGKFSNMEIEVLYGGQEHYYYLISVE